MREHHERRKFKLVEPCGHVKSVRGNAWRLNLDVELGVSWVKNSGKKKKKQKKSGQREWCVPGPFAG